MKSILALILNISAFLFLFSCGNWPYKPAQFIAPVPPPPENAFVSRDSLSNFIGAHDIKLSYTKLTNGIQVVYFVDFNDSFPYPKGLKKPIGRQDWDAWCPIISPDGSLVTYYLVSGSNIKHSAAYCQALDTGAVPVLISEPGSDPHFFMDSASDGLFVTYADTTGFMQGDLTLITGHATYKQQVDPETGRKTGSPQKILDYPFFGGMSVDGKFICTGYSYAYFFNLFSQKLFAIDPLKQTCNPSMTPAKDSPGRMMFLNIGGVQALDNMGALASVNCLEHKYIFIADTNNNMVNSFSIVDMVPGMSGQTGCEWQCPKWSNAPDFFCALTSPDGSDPWDCYIVSISKNTLLKLNRPSLLAFDGTSKPYMHIGAN